MSSKKNWQAAESRPAESESKGHTSIFLPPSQQAQKLAALSNSGTSRSWIHPIALGKFTHIPSESSNLSVSLGVMWLRENFLSSCAPSSIALSMAAAEGRLWDIRPVKPAQQPSAHPFLDNRTRRCRRPNDPRRIRRNGEGRRVGESQMGDGDPH